MLDYAALDVLADSHNPLLAVVALALIVSAVAQRRGRLALLRLAGVLAALAVVYGFKLADDRLGLWPRFGVDYATHTAVALAAATYLVAQAPRLWAFWIASFAGYTWLVLHQRYHTPADLLSTCAAVAGPLLAAAWWIGRASHAPGRSAGGPA